MGECIKFGRGFIQIYDPAFANNEWSKIISACQRGTVPDTWKVGDQKAMTINGTDYQIDIIGKNHDSYSDGSGTAPLTFQMHDCYVTSYAMNATNTNVGGWGSSGMRTSILPQLLAKMPTEVQAGIKEVDKLTTKGNTSGLIDTSADKLFLLSEIEVFGGLGYSKAGEGSRYAYYSAGNSTVKKRGASETNWWERSPSGNKSQYFCCVGTPGLASGVMRDNPANEMYGVSFAFCF